MSQSELRPRAINARQGRAGSRRRRADSGKLRLDPRLQQRLAELFSEAGPLHMKVVERRIREFCQRWGLSVPSRAVLYRARHVVPLPPRRKSSLPLPIREALYNLGDEALVPGEQIVFYAFNYGTTAAMSYAAGLPIVCLERAERLRGWRPRSLSLLRCVLLQRGRQRASLPAN